MNIDHEPVICPRCSGDGKLSYSIPSWKMVDGQRWPTSQAIESVCNLCMGHKKVHPVQAIKYERDTQIAFEEFLKGTATHGNPSGG